MPGIILPEGEDPHRVLLSSCTGCHPENVPAFWLMVFPEKKPVTKPVSKMISGKPSFPNPHDSMDCNTCHRNIVSFETITGGEKDLVETTGDVSDFCRRCHQEIVKQHFPRGNIPVGGTTCLSCHRIHHPTSIPPALREDYYTFIRETQELNPHGGSPFCLVCHVSKPMPGVLPEFIVGAFELNKLCTRCHVGMDHHVIDRPSTEKTWKMDFLNFPLQEKKIACVTCHKPHGGLVASEGGGSYSLRGEPYQKTADFCRNCHEEKGWVKFNPHDQLTPSGEIITRSCLFCHNSVPETSSERYVSSSDFNDTLTEICVQCHEATPHPEADHLVEPGPMMLSMMETYENDREVLLPLDFDGQVTCATCHNPHEKGLIKGPGGIGADERTRMRLATFNEICAPCHGRH